MPLFSRPAGQVVVILTILFERDIRAVSFVLLLNVVITLAWQVLSEWLGLMVEALTWGLLRVGSADRRDGHGRPRSVRSHRAADIRLPAAPASSPSLRCWLA